MKRRKVKAVVGCLCVFLLVLLSVVYGLYSSKYFLTASYYTLSSDRLTAPLRIVQLTDLHNSEFGEENSQLVAAVEAGNPDLILLTGDLVNADEESADIAMTLIEQLVRLAPVYVSLGNHEKDYEKRWGTDLSAVYEAVGAKVLEYAYEDILVKDQALRLGGIYGYCLPEVFLKTGEAKIRECDFLKEFLDTESCTLLLCHMPYAWLECGALEDWEIDGVFAGHLHGGQIRLPLLGGLYAPDQGFFPGKVAGMYVSEDASRAMFLSRGLGSTGRIPRFGNVPELLVVDLLPK